MVNGRKVGKEKDKEGAEEGSSSQQVDGWPADTHDVDANAPLFLPLVPRDMGKVL